MATATAAVAPAAERKQSANGTAMASWLAAGIGAFAMAFVALLNEAGIFATPTLYGPAGGVSGRTTLATVTWLMAWGVLHNRWKGREIASRGVQAVTLILIALGILGTLPSFLAAL
jgi:hypothetical protein